MLVYLAELFYELVIALRLLAGFVDFLNKALGLASASALFKYFDTGFLVNALVQGVYQAGYPFLHLLTHSKTPYTLRKTKTRCSKIKAFHSVREAALGIEGAEVIVAHY